ncbi:PAAR domain-containing protein [Caballeronia sp. AZ1_KS37]|uniref:PAAR domain-containing protein n=1 Tax=Caballeronia sp. AZ1_KS37 TaxID=2921756 RepID=UPI0032EF1BFD
MSGIIRMGDRHTGDGAVTQGSSTCVFMGRPVARLHDRVTCPKHGDAGHHGHEADLIGPATALLQPDGTMGAVRMAGAGAG